MAQTVQEETRQKVTKSGDDHRAEATALTAKAAEWSATRDAALKEAADLKAGAGLRVLEDPTSMTVVADKIVAAQARARLATAAYDEACKGAHAASVAALRADAAAFDPQIERAQERLTEHLAKRDAMLAELIEFSNAEWQIHTVDDLDVRERVARGEKISMKHPKAYQMSDAIGVLQTKRQRILDEADRMEADPSWTPPEPPSPRDWQAEVDEARTAAAQTEKVLARATAFLKSANTMQRGTAIEAHRAAQRRRDEASAWMHTLVGQAEVFGAGVQ